jgi:hypothetical protein
MGGTKSSATLNFGWDHSATTEQKRAVWISFFRLIPYVEFRPRIQRCANDSKSSRYRGIMTLLTFESASPQCKSSPSNQGPTASRARRQATSVPGWAEPAPL